MKSGEPDLILCLAPSGRHVTVECKQPGGKATPQQLARLREYRLAGSIAIVCDDPAQGVADIEEVLRDGHTLEKN